MNEDEDLDLVVVSTFDSLEVCCHEELLRMPINGLLRLIVDLNSRLSTTMQITDTLTKSEDRLRKDVEAVLGYKRLLPTEPETLVVTSRDSGLGLLGFLSAGRAPDAQAVPFTPPRIQQKDSNNSLNDRQKLTVSMRGKPRLADLMEEEPETGDSKQTAGKSPIRRSDRQHSLTQSSRDRVGEAATLPRARNLRNLQNHDGNRVRFRLFCSRAHYSTKQQPLMHVVQDSSRTSGGRNHRYNQSSFDAPAFGSIIRAKPKLHHSLPTRRGKLSFESSSTREPRFRHDFRHVPTLGSRTSMHSAPHNLRKPSLELFEMDRLICNMLSVSASTDHSRGVNSDLQEFGIL